MANKKRLIDVNAVLMWLDEITDQNEWLVSQYNADWIWSMLDSAPTVDAVEVVRCRDCLHGRKVDNKKAPEKYFREDCVVCECEDVVGDEPMIYPPRHFCSYGEKKK